MEFIRLTHENLEQEHICCAISSNKDIQVMSKKAWLSERLEEGLVFLKGDVRGKCFIEYIPAEYAWSPVDAEGYMFIDCFWISGQFKGHGYSNTLLNECIRDSKEQGKKVWWCCPQKRRWASFPTQNTCSIRAFRLRTWLSRILSFGIFPFSQVWRNHVSSPVSARSYQGFPPVSRCIIPVSVPSPPNMSRCWKLPPKNPVWHSRRYISPPGNRHRASPALSQPLRFIMTEGLLRMKSNPSANFKSF